MEVTARYVTKDYALVRVEIDGHRLELGVSRDGGFTLYGSRMESEATRRNWPIAVGNVREEENAVSYAFKELQNIKTHIENANDLLDLAVYRLGKEE